MDRSLDISGSLAIFFGYHWRIDNKPNHNNHKIWYKIWYKTLTNLYWGWVIDWVYMGLPCLRRGTTRSPKLPRASRRLLAEDVASAKRITSQPKMTKNHQKIDGCSMDVPWISMEFRWFFKWISMDCLWNFYGFSPASPAAAASDEAQRHWTRLLSAVVVSTWASSGSQKISLPTIEFHRKHWFSILSIGSES